MNRDEINDFLKGISNLSSISDKKKGENYENVGRFNFNIEGYKFSIYCIYKTACINVWHGDNLNVFAFVFDIQNGRKDFEEAEKFFKVIHLPPNLIINELTRIGVNEL